MASAAAPNIRHYSLLHVDLNQGHHLYCRHGTGHCRHGTAHCRHAPGSASAQRIQQFGSSGWRWLSCSLSRKPSAADGQLIGHDNNNNTYACAIMRALGDHHA